MSFDGLFFFALRGFSTNRLRAALTMLGIVIGVASVIATLAIGNGARAAVEASFLNLRADVLQVTVRGVVDDGVLVEAGQTLTYEDGVLMPEMVELVDRVDMTVSGTARVRRGGAALEVRLEGVTADALAFLSTQSEVQPRGWSENRLPLPREYLQAGRFFTTAEVLSAANLCVLGSETAAALFTGDDPLVQEVFVNRQRCLVIGILAELEHTDADLRAQSRPNEVLYMPVSAVVAGLYEREPSVTILAHVSDVKRMEEAETQVAEYLRDRHTIQPREDGSFDDDFILTTRREVLGTQQEVARTLSLLLASLAVVSLLVGGIGVMNVMLVSVSERTREIGVRRAVGARQADILVQFLFEAALLGAGGGILGTALGILSVPLAASLADGLALLAPGSIPLALAFAIFTGLVSGLYPAFRAARLDPIEALRYE